MNKKRALSGIQPTGKTHIGNYFGAIRRHINLQNQHEGFYFIANYHALTNPRSAEELRTQTRDVALDYLALGLDPNKATLFRQSDIPEVTEMTWFLSTVTPMGLLERCHAYKDKINKGIKPNHGLFAYPVLMASDILIYDADVVPVGSDQKQHVEVTRDLAEKWNNEYDQVLKIPEAHILDEVATIPGTDGQKMSKSYGNTICPFSPEDELKQQVFSIETDSTPIEEPKDPDSCNLYAIFRLFADEEETHEVRSRYVEGGLAYGDLKNRVFERILDHFKDARKKRKKLQQKPDYVEDVLRNGAKEAREIASQTLARVRESAGMQPAPQ